MEWRKLKNIILLILLALNLALVALIGGPRLSAYARENRANQEVLAFLEGKGIGISPEVIPGLRQYRPLAAQRNLQQEALLAGNLLGEHAVQETQGGEVYRYESETGMIQFHSDGTFWAELSAEHFPLHGDPTAAALKVLEGLNFSGEILTEGENSLTVRQCLEDGCLFSQQATVTWNEIGITGIVQGRRLYGEAVEDTSRACIDRATALISFYNGLSRMGDVCSRVDRIEPGYVSTSSLNKVMTLTPVWRVTTDTGVYQLDLVTAVLERVG